MNQGGGQKKIKVSEQQIDILLWLAEQEERKPIELAGVSNTLTATESTPLTVNVNVMEAPDVATAQLSHKVKKIGKRWNPAAFFGRPLTPSESAAISRRLKSLERQGLIKRTKSRGKRVRTSHIKLTAEGWAFAYERRRR
jgi:hypothetical protein